MTNAELKELVHLLMMCGIMDKTATESGNVTNDEWLRMKNLISKYQEEKEQPEVKGDLISREALKEKLKPCEADDCESYCEDCHFRVVTAEDIDNAQPIEQEVYIHGEDYDFFIRGYKEGRKDFERPKGEWIKKVDKVGFISNICSNCGAEIEYENPCQDHFCYNCGADMRKGKNNERL